MTKLGDFKGELSGYAKVVGSGYIESMKKAAEESGAKRVFMVNATKNGGGVAILMNSIVPIMNNLRIETHWLELKANPEFFNVTKSFHNGLQGEKFDNIDDKIEEYKRFYEEDFQKYNEEIMGFLDSLGKGDMVVIHDPQPLGMIDYRKDDGSTWIWRCHIDSSHPDEKLWNFVEDLAKKYDKRIVSKDEFKHGDLDWEIIPPSIDPTILMNKDIDDDVADDIIEILGVPRDKPMITQVSRFDKWKDPVGVVEVFSRVRKDVDCSLVLVYNGASDDPEGDMMYKKVSESIEKCEYSDDIHLVRGDRQTIVNVFQRASDVVLQKSLREGFALTVSEALWKASPVVATKVGGIPLQVIDGFNGYLVEPYDYGVNDERRESHIGEVASKVASILLDEEKAKELGENAKEYVRKNFLITRQVMDYLELFKKLKVRMEEAPEIEVSQESSV